ncbi:MULTISPECIES: helix-turn-helix domain-containing protein [Helcococcus]|uniref:Helix-turn-helix transcriptional regulator n=1 Tax=Helcococcus bovis TaxID=3153252 RepID=A0ABW9F956_9FIRM
MECNLGDKLKEIRKSKNLSIESFAYKLNISPRQYSRIESNQSTPSLESLQKFSEILKIDLFKIYKELNDNDILEYLNLRNSLFVILDNREMDKLEEFLYNIESKYQHCMNTRNQILIEQIYLFAKGTLFLYNRNFHKSLEILNNSLKITIPNFKIKNFKTFEYNDIEYRILFCISFNYEYMNMQKIYLDIIKFMEENISEDNILYIQFIYNKYVSIYKNRQFEIVINELSKIISKLEKENKHKNLDRLYFLIGLSKKEINDTDYKNYIKKSIKIATLFKQQQLIDLYEYFLK